ncbi:biopolymer transporter ExbD [Verrucomicrobium sp. BvORR106]|uniref:ExbD/TolR family protein n=1 Tax=Verrucomicrobium sp. BvORR106 TaxID=1403819 RepID=UPI0005714A91|nr:biopolymer transporter ExbD [Verrucomicrobium sp. BvORR106]
MGGGGGSMESGEPEFQIAPMIDCLLVLLIFFMSITTAEVLQLDKDIQLPAAPEAKKKEKSKMAEGALNVKWNPKTQKGEINFEGKPYDDVSSLVEVLKVKKANAPDYRIIIRGDRRLPAVEIQRTMSVLGEAGMDDLAFSALNQ